MSQPLSFLVVDDEEAIQLSLKTVISKYFTNVVVQTASDGMEGWNYINNEHPMIVISDISMPGYSGIDLLKKVRNEKALNDIYFIILTADTDKKLRLRMLEDGADDYLTKPFIVEELTARLASAARFVKLQQRMKEENRLLLELADELESSLKDLRLLAVKFLQARIPDSTEKLKQVAKAATWIASQIGEFNEKQLNDIEIAGLLCHAGKICLPDELVKQPVMVAGKPTNKLMFQVPLSARDILTSVRRYKGAGEILYHVYENFDGTGFPDRKQSWQIPMASRIIRVVLDFEELKAMTKKPSKEVLGIISRESKRLYDHRIVILLDQYIGIVGNETSNSNERPVMLQDLQEGMVLARDIITNSGLKLMPAGAVLQEKIIKRIFSHNASDPIIGYIYIKDY